MDNALTILWKTTNVTTIETLVLLYATNAKKKNWFETVDVIIWGDSQNVAASNQKIRNMIRKSMQEGVRFYACKYCSDHLNITAELEALGVNVMYTGVLLTERLKTQNVLTL
jgi:hypothetical protein